MVSPAKLSQSNLPIAIQQRILSHFQADWGQRLNVEQMFALINGVLPLEACLYYQVLPLFLDGNRLHLGMVTPNDTTALEYVRRIVSYLNYSLVPRAIAYDALQVALTAYLNYTGDRQASPSPSSKEALPARYSYGHYRHSAQARLEPLAQNIRPTLILDSPDELPDTLAAPNLGAIDATVDAPPKQLQHSDEQQATPKTPQLVPPSPPIPSADDPDAPVLPPLIAAVPPLVIQAQHLADPVEILATLPPPMLLQELLARVLVGGIGRLYFECHLQHGRVLWSQDGILQSILDSLPLPSFHQLLQELKEIAHASPSPSPQQVEIERLYDRSRVLLRFRFMVGKYGEEATLQVLRGAALRFHQKQQLSTLKRDALGIAKQLQTKLNEIRDRAYAEPGLAAARFEALPGLNQLLQTIEDQLNELENADEGKERI
jgi:hypothetical protein